MAAAGMIGHAHILATTSGTPFTVTDITSVSFSGKSTDSVGITSESSASYFKEFIPGEVDPGTCSFTANYKEALYKTLSDLHDARTVATWKYTWPDASYLTFSGFLMSGECSSPDQGKVEMTFTIKMTGLPVITTA